MAFTWQIYELMRACVVGGNSQVCKRHPDSEHSAACTQEVVGLECRSTSPQSVCWQCELLLIFILLLLLLLLYKHL